MHHYIKIALMGHGLEQQQISPLIPPVLLVTFRTRRLSSSEGGVVGVLVVGLELGG
jgi:hypothetical protein